jgi:release factor glutamine methyltransferase
MLETAAPVTTDASGSYGSVRGAISALSKSFRAAGIEGAELDARLLVLHACNLSREAYISDADRSVGLEEADRIASFEIRRLAHEPVSRTIGIREFWGRDFQIGPAVLDPRPDTETLVEAALVILGEDRFVGTQPRILDLGTGSGCILLTLLAEWPGAWGLGVDIDDGTLSMTRKNASRLGVQDRCAFVRSNWCDALTGRFDLITANPPYIRTDEIAELDASVRDYDPELALDGGADGLDAYRHIAGSCALCVRPGGWIVLEAGRGQANEIVRIFAEAGWSSALSERRIYRDLAGIERVVAIKRQAAL